MFVQDTSRILQEELHKPRSQEMLYDLIFQSCNQILLVASCQLHRNVLIQ